MPDIDKATQRRIDNALRMIKAKGQLVKWHVNAELANTDEPWKSDTETAPEKEYDVYIVFLPRDRMDTQLIRATDTSIPIGSVYGLMGAVDFNITAKDTVIRDGSEIRINAIDTIAPNGIPVLHTIDFSL